MLTNLIQTYTSRLTFQLSQSIVMRYEKKRSIFDKTNYNPEWVPRVRQYSKHRKPALKQWTDPEVVLPQYIPPLHKKINFRTFVKQNIEKQQAVKASTQKEYILEDIRSGDIIDIVYQQTFESDKTVTHRAFVLAFKRRKSLTAALQVLVRLGGMNLKAIYLINSPKVRNIKLIGRGSGTFRSNIKDGWENVKRIEALRPRMRNNVLKNRSGFKKKQKSHKVHSSIKFDQFKSDSSRRIIM